MTQWQGSRPAGSNWEEQGSPAWMGPNFWIFWQSKSFSSARVSFVLSRKASVTSDGVKLGAGLRARSALAKARCIISMLQRSADAFGRVIGYAPGLHLDYLGLKFKSRLYLMC